FSRRTSRTEFEPVTQLMCSTPDWAAIHDELRSQKHVTLQLSCEFDDDGELRVDASGLVLHNCRRKLPLIDCCADALVNKRITARDLAGGDISGRADSDLDTDRRRKIPEHGKRVCGELRIDAGLKARKGQLRGHLNTAGVAARFHLRQNIFRKSG